MPPAPGGEAQPLLRPPPGGAAGAGHPALEATWLGGGPDARGKGEGKAAKVGEGYMGGDAPEVPEATFGLPPGICYRVFLERCPAGPHAWPPGLAPAHPGLDDACEPLRPLFRARGAWLIGDWRGFVALLLLAAAAGWAAADMLPTSLLKSNPKAGFLLPELLPFAAALIALVYLACVATRWTCNVDEAVEQQLGPALNDALRAAGLGHLQARVKLSYKSVTDDWGTYKRRQGLTFESEPECFFSWHSLHPPEGLQRRKVWSTFWLWVDFVDAAAALEAPAAPASAPWPRRRGLTMVRSGWSGPAAGSRLGNYIHFS